MNRINNIIVINSSKLFFLLIFLLLNMPVSGQPITFQKTIIAPDIEYFTSVVQTSDEGYLAVGRKRYSGISDDMYIVRYNRFGDTLWSKTVNVELAECMIATFDNNYLICGHEGSLVKINQNGDILQIKQSLGYDFLIISSLLQSNSGDFFISGVFRSNLDSPYLAKYDSNLNLVFDSVYISNRFYGGFSDMVLSNESTLIFVGYEVKTAGNPLYLFLSNIDQNGNVIWENTFTQRENLISRTIAKTGGNDFIVGGYRFLAKFSSTGFNQWYQNIDSPYYNEIWDIEPTYDNSFIMSGWYYDNLNAYARIRKIDTNGNTLWVRSHGFAQQNNEGWVIKQTIDTGFIVAGRTDIQEDDPYILKLDKSGNLSVNAVNIISNNIPSNFKLYQNFPNPFNPQTTIRFDVPKDAMVSVKVYDLLGREVYSISDYQTAGTHELKFDGSNLASGMYFYSVEANGFRETKKMVLLK